MYLLCLLCSDVTNTSSYSSNLGKSTSSSKSGGGGGAGLGSGGSKDETSQPSALEPVDFSSNPALSSLCYAPSSRTSFTTDVSSASATDNLVRYRSKLERVVQVNLSLE